MAKVPKNKVSTILQKYRTGVATSDDKPGKPAPKDARSKGVPEPASIVTGQDGNLVANVLKNPRWAALVLTPFMSEDPAKKDLLYRYAKRAVKDSLNRGEAPLASHIFYYEFFNNNLIQTERDMGFISQVSWIQNADLIVVYIDFGITQAMKAALDVAKLKNKRIEYRTITATA